MSSKFTALRVKIVSWAQERNIIRGSQTKDQFCKLVQEVGELSDSICKGKCAKDDIGDITVVLLILCEQLGLDYDECVEAAYEDIKNRKGIMRDGVFIKEGD
jgi:NTP pyrophosphatase (non-canonical NTP hydrolase)